MTNQLTFDKIEFVTYGAYDTFPGKLNPIAAAIRGESEMGGGGGLKGILGAVIAIAVPFVAPYVATAVFSSSIMAGAVSGVLASAATGAVLGAAGAALTGGDWKRGALFGGIGGGLTQGLGGFGSYNAQTGSINTNLFSSAAPTGGNVTTGGGGVYGQGTAGAIAQNVDELGNVIAASADDTAGAVVTGQNLQPVAASNYGTTLSSQTPVTNASSYTGGVQAGTPAYASGNAGTALSSSNVVTQTPGANTVLSGGSTSPYSLTTGASGPGLRLPTRMAGDITSVSQIAPKPTTFLGELGSRFTNPARMADMAILATPQIIGQVYAMQAGKEQQKQIEKYQQELKALEGKDQAAYELKLKEAQEYIANAKNINPNYWGQMAANQANITGARRLAESYRDAPMAGLRDLSGERRRALIGLSENVGTAYNQGYQTGVGIRDQAMRTGYGMIPSGPRTGLDGARGMSDMYANLDRARAGAAQGVSQTASYFTYPFLSNYRV